MTCSPITRRTLSRGVIAGVAGLKMPWVVRPAKAASPRLTIATWEGTYQDSFTKIFAQPFTQETGIEVIVGGPPDMAKVKAQIQSGRIEWDIFDGPGALVLAGQALGCWERLDHDVIDTSNLAALVFESGVPYLMVTNGMCWDGKNGPDPAPVTIHDMFDAKRFPGWRGFRTRVSETLELALLSDGVAPANLYPLDVERAFNVLHAIKPRVKKWIDVTTESTSMVSRGEISYSYANVGRVLIARKGGATLTMSLKQTLSVPDYFAVLKGAPNKDTAMRFIAFALRPDRQVAFCNATYFVPARKTASDGLAPEIKDWLPDPGGNVVIDDKWWLDKYTDLQARFDEWRLLG